MGNKNLSPRFLAVLTVQEVLTHKQPLTQVLETHKSSCQVKDRALYQALCFGLLRGYLEFKFLVDKLLEFPLKPKDQEVFLLICLGILQIEKMRIPTHAAVSESVETAKKFKKPWAPKLVNAILRSFLRRREELFSAMSKEDTASTLHPRWIIDKLKQEWPNHLESIFLENNKFPPFTLRVNQRKITRDAYLKKLSEQNILAYPIEGLEAGIILNEAKEVNDLPGFTEGLFSVQDGAAQFAGPLLMPEAGDRVLDCCSAPGGKLTHLLEMRADIEAIGVDISAKRVKLIEENLQRLQLKSKVIVADANKPNTFWDGKPFDRILCDASCSASGVIRRHPEIKFLRTQEDILRLSAEQLKLLLSIWPLLRTGGILLYSTCSIFSEENEDVIKKFLSLQKDAVIDRFELPYGISLTWGHQILPGQGNMDGFYYARLRKMG